MDHRPRSRRMVHIVSMLMSELCGICAVTKDTVRYYHRLGILMAAEKDPRNGYGTYDETHVERLRYIKKLQSFGFALKEIASAIELNESDSMTDEIRIQTLHRKLEEVTVKLADLASYRESILTAISNLEGGSSKR